MELTLPPSQRDIEQLKSALEEKQRHAEYEKLKKDLMQISLEANHQLTEFDGGLKQVDTHKILKDQNRKRHFADFIIQGFVKMMSPRPVARNLLAIGLIFSAVFCVMQLLDIKQINPYKIYFCYFLELAVTIQILKSSARSLFIPDCYKRQWSHVNLTKLELRRFLELAEELYVKSSFTTLRINIVGQKTARK